MRHAKTTTVSRALQVIRRVATLASHRRGSVQCSRRTASATRAARAASTYRRWGSARRATARAPAAMDPARWRAQVATQAASTRSFIAANVWRLALLVLPWARQRTVVTRVSPVIGAAAPVPRPQMPPRAPRAPRPSERSASFYRVTLLLAIADRAVSLMSMPRPAGVRLVEMAAHVVAAPMRARHVPLVWFCVMASAGSQLPS